MTNETIFQLSNYLDAIASKCTGKLGYYVAKNLRLLKNELVEYNDKRNELIRKYGTQNGDNIVIENGSEAYFNFMKELKEYDSIESGVNLIKFDSSLLENSTLDAREQMVMLEYFISD